MKTQSHVIPKRIKLPTFLGAIRRLRFIVHLIGSGADFELL